MLGDLLYMVTRRAGTGTGTGSRSKLKLKLIDWSHWTENASPIVRRSEFTYCMQARVHIC